jgi:hypothetical protein
MKRVGWFSATVLALGLVGVAFGCTASDPAPAASSDATCSTYCTRILDECTGANAMYRDNTQCLAACKALDPANETGKSGNTVNCRLARLDNKDCPGAGLLGGGVCGQRCDGFCKVTIATCGTQADPPFDGIGSCVEQCTSSIPFDPNATEGVDQPLNGEDTLNCRVQHLLLAIEQPVPHCGHLRVQSSMCNGAQDAGGD